MTDQHDNPKQPNVRIAVLFAVLAVLLFAAAFYLLDGMQLVQDLLGKAEQPDVVVETPGVVVTSNEGLVLPKGMPQEFALRLWQEQIDSQANTRRLVDGEVESILITRVTQTGDDAVLDITAAFADGPSVQGTLEMQRYSGQWYFARLSGLRSDSAPATETPLPSIEDVDIELLSTIVEQQSRSAAVLEEYATGVVKEIVIDRIIDGPGTVTIKIEMNETHEEGYGELILIEKSINGEPHWFVARFTKEVAE